MTDERYSRPQTPRRRRPVDDETDDERPRRPQRGGGAPDESKLTAKRVRKAAPAEPNPYDDVSTDELLDAFVGDVEPVETTGSYKLGIFLTGGVMLLLVAIYVGAILLTVYGLGWHAFKHLSLLSKARGGAVVVAFFLYIGPMIGGAVMVLFMLKPIFSQPAGHSKPRVLSRKREPRLFDFVDRICEAVGSPYPGRIVVDCEVNASASFRRGVFSFWSNDLVLTIGMPMAAGLNLRQFGGVLAHEFGHFSQAAGMRVTYMSRTIAYWFARVIYERDEWDERLYRWSKSMDLRIAWVLYLARFFVWLTRKILWCIYMLGNLVTGYMLREMEYDADRHQARLAGSDSIKSTLRRVTELGIAHDGAVSDIYEFHREGRLADDLPRLIMANVKHFNKETRTEIDKRLKEVETGVFDSHPSDRDRVANAAAEDARGVFRLIKPAAVLFGDFRGLCRQLTLDLYRERLEKRIKPDDLHPTDELVEKQAAEYDSYKSLGRYYQGVYSTLRAIAMPSWELEQPGDAQACIETVEDWRKEMLGALPRYKRELQRYDKVDDRLVEAAQARAILDAGFRITADIFDGRFRNRKRLKEEREEWHQKEYELSDRMERFETAVGERLYNALQLLLDEQVAAKLAEPAEDVGLCRKILPALEVVSNQLFEATRLRNQSAAMSMLLASMEGNEHNRKLIETILARMQRMADLIDDIDRELDAVVYPFEHGEGEITLARYALKELPDPENPGELMYAAEQVMNTIVSLNARFIARLCVVGEEVEEALGMLRLPEPKDGE